MPTALIIGASRGIGHELARQYRADGWRVIATARSDDALAQLSALGCEAFALDVTSAESCAAFAWKLDDEHLDVAILNAGIYGPDTHGMTTPDEQNFDAVMHTNVLAAMRLLPLAGPLLAHGGKGGKLAVISSNMGSISRRNSNSGWLYRASKAALNSVLADAAIALGPQGVVCAAFHPGWVRTDMGGAGADITVDASAGGIRAMLAQLTQADNGQFYSYDGQRLEW
jgi:NAD(P)-dependent dehydrogenase (short-subunit alcohol dehydrogenase family)